MAPQKEGKKVIYSQGKKKIKLIKYSDITAARYSMELHPCNQTAQIHLSPKIALICFNL